MTELLSVGGAMLLGRRVLWEAEIETAGLDAALLLMRAANLTRTELATKEKTLLSPAQTRVYRKMLLERAAHKPVAYILNTCEFMSLSFYVDERVLIPRPDTELLAEAVIDEAKKAGGFIRILDIGTGSGALSVSTAHYAPGTLVTAADISGDALDVARINIEKHGLSDRVTLLCGDLFNALPADTEPFHIIMSNPPYIPENETIPLSVSLYEPPEALFGGKSGLDFYARIIARAADYLVSPQGKLFLEIGYDQGGEVSRMLETHGFTEITVFKDLAGMDRMIRAACP